MVIWDFRYNAHKKYQQYQSLLIFSHYCLIFNIILVLSNFLHPKIDPFCGTYYDPSNILIMILITTLL